jgi:hypothetical protein
MPRRALTVAFIVGVLLWSRGQEARAAGRKAALLQPMLEVLDKAKLSGSLEFSGRCELQDFPDFPQFRAAETSGGSSPQALREILADDAAMRVMQNPEGTIRMIESGVPTDLLNIRISHISFENNENTGVYAPNAALRFILSAPEVVAFMKAHDIEWPFAIEGGSGIAGAWPPEFPHISGSLDDVTLSQALDHVLKTFPGIWMYENCPRTDQKNRVVYFRFFFLRRLGSSVPFVDE